LSRISLALQSFFGILFQGELPEKVVRALGYSKGAKAADPSPPAPTSQLGPAQGAVQLLGILQRDARLVDLLMEDISGASDDQVGAAFRQVQEQARQCLQRYIQLAPVIDGVEGAYTRTGGLGVDSAALKLLGNVPPDGNVSGGILRHKGWKAEKVSLPPLNIKQDLNIVAPAEVEIE